MSDRPRRIVLEAFRPIADSVEWRVGTAYWHAAGRSAFHADGVPHLITNDGMLAARDADVLLASCLLAERAGTLEGEIGVLELGSGLGVYARQFLDRFAERCADERLDFYARLTYHVSDGSPRMLDDIATSGALELHAERVRFGWVEATNPRAFAPHDGGPPVALEGLRAIVASYLLDSLPFDVLMRTGEQWMRMYYRTALEGAPADLELDPADLAAGNGALAVLVPLADRLSIEHAYMPVDPTVLPRAGALLAFADETPSTGASDEVVVHSHGALTALTVGLELLRPDGFVIYHDYGGKEVGHRPAKHERFARSRATGLNLALLDHALQAAGHRVIAPDGDDDAPIHTRLVSPTPSYELDGAFLTAYDLQTLERVAALLDEARAQRTSNPIAARACYQTAQELAPENWRVLADWADFEHEVGGDDYAAIDLARSAIEMNPTGSPIVHNVLGDSLASIGEMGGAEAAFRAALALHPDDVRGRAGVARLLAFQDRYPEAIEQLAGAIARDTTGAYRALLQARLDQILDLRDAAAQ